MREPHDTGSSIVPVGTSGLAKIQNALRVTDSLINSYDSVIIGEQEWMTRNLNVSRFRNGDVIPEIKDDAEWQKAGEVGKPAWCYYQNDPDNGRIYGKLYNWHAVNDPRGLAPKGWSLPSKDDWENLIEFLGGKYIAGGRLKAPGIEYWGTGYYSPNENVGEHNSGFLALPNGFRFRNGPFDSIGELSWIWSGSDYKNVAYLYVLSNNSLNIDSLEFSKADGYAIRCLKTIDSNYNE